MKRILILGAGIYQVPLITKAKELGYFTIVLSIKGNYPGFALADKIYHENTTDIDACVKIAKDEQISGVCTTGTDVALPALGAICDALGLQGISEHSAKLSSNKLLMKEAFIKNNVRTAKFIKVESFEECLSACREIGFPVVLKVTDSSGSRGISIVKEEKDIENEYRNVITYTQQKYILVEQFVGGKEFGAEAFVYNNEIQFVIPHGKFVYQAKTGIPAGHYIPFDSVPEIMQDSIEQVKKSIIALCINNAAVNADLMLCDDGKVYVLEIGARAGATCLPEMVSEYYDIDYYEYILRLAMNDLPEISFNEENPCVVKLLISEKSGIISNIILPPKNENVIRISSDYKIGDKINKFKNGTDRIGEVIVRGKTLQEAMKNCDMIMKEIVLEVK